MGKKDCEMGNWKNEGKLDAMDGWPLSHFVKQKKACQKHGIEIDQTQYESGYNEGIKLFCTFKSGYRYGRKGGNYQDTCPANLEPEFFKGFVAGKKQRSVEDKLEEQQNQIKEQEDQIEKLRREMDN